MREKQWLKWTETRLEPLEREALLTALTSKQTTHLLENDYVWGKRIGVLWNPPHAAPLRRARFTHGTHFETSRGEFYIDSEGGVRGFSDRSISNPLASGAASVPSQTYSAQNAKAT